MADTLAILRWGFQVYLLLIAGLGLFTVGWSVSNLLVPGNASLAMAWFALAGLGTLLVAVLLLRHFYLGDSVSAM